MEAFYLLIKRGTIGEVYNVGNDAETRILDLAKLVKAVAHSNSEIKFFSLPPDEPIRRSADITKLRTLGFRHYVSLEKGIRNTI